MADKMLRIAGRDPNGSARPASMRLDDNSLGIMRMFLESVLSSNQDSVALGGAIANSLAQKPSGQQRLIVSNRAIPSTGGGATVVSDIFNITSNIMLQSLQVVGIGTAAGTSPSFDLMRKQSNGADDVYNYISKDGVKPIADIQNLGVAAHVPYYDPLFDLIHIGGESSTEKAWLLKNRPEVGLIHFPYGLRLTANNWSATLGYTVHAQIMYLIMP
jgi:hypothetical protein